MTEEPRYALHRRVEVEPRELDAPSGELVEVILRWGAQVLLVRHLRAGERFIASADPADRGADVFVDRSVLFGDAPEKSNSWVCIRSEGGVWRVCPPPASGLDPYALEARATLALGSLELCVRRVSPARAIARRAKVDRAMMGAFVGATIAVSALAGVNVWIDASYHPMLSDEGMRDRDLWISHMVARTYRAQDARGADARGARGESNEPAPGAANERLSQARPKVQRVLGAAYGRYQQRVLGRQAVAQRGIFAALGAFSASSFTTAFDSLRAPTNSVLGVSGQSSVGATVADAFGFGGLGGGIASHGGGEEIVSGCGCDSSIGYGDEVFSGMGVGAFGERFSTAAGAGSRLRERATVGPRVRTARGPSVCGGPPGVAATCAPSDDRLYPADAIRRVVQRNMGQVQHCFEQALARRSTTEGRVEVRFVIGPNGAVMGAVVASNDTGDALLGQCATDAFRRWNFPPPPSVVTVNYPLSMRSE
ncbi:MAG: TonB family protein [Myxococcales bacterium]|nr:TonB family protein [Myxococcales bacterium]